jgi:hypothetical protein
MIDLEHGQITLEKDIGKLPQLAEKMTFFYFGVMSDTSLTMNGYYYIFTFYAGKMFMDVLQIGVWSIVDSKFNAFEAHLTYICLEILEDIKRWEMNPDGVIVPYMSWRIN